MAEVKVKSILDLVKIPYERIWTSYDKEADVLYINFKKPSHADDSELTEDDLIIRYEKGEIVGITVLNAILETKALEQKMELALASEASLKKKIG